MKTMILNSYGQDAQFELTEVDKPQVAAEQVLVRIAASSVNTVDTMIRKMGKDLPVSPDIPAMLGMDFSGTIEAVGSNVKRFNLGDEVYGCAGGMVDLPGTLAEYIAADSRLVARKPRNISMKEAAALPLVAITAYEGLVRAAVRPGQKVLIHGGSGGVGHVAVQIAKHFGAGVYATVSDLRKMEIMKSYGATPINYKIESVEDYVSNHTGGNGFDVVFDTVGGDNLNYSFQAAALNGQVVTTIAFLQLDLTVAHFKGLSIHIVFMLIPMLHNYRREDHGEILEKVAQIVEAGKLKPLLDESQFSMEEIGKAHTRLESGQAIGKVVVENKVIK